MNWKYYWRRYLGWFPVQFCMVCGHWYWGGFPQWSKDIYFGQKDGKPHWCCIWQAWMKEYCSRECADIDMESQMEAANEVDDFGGDDDLWDEDDEFDEYGMPLGYDDEEDEYE